MEKDGDIHHVMDWGNPLSLVVATARALDTAVVRYHRHCESTIRRQSSFEW
ncbi:MAG: hypothetical protein ACI81O_000855 [Cyclobacteriaceae bacterium]|jgi:hypothetical protein